MSMAACWWKRTQSEGLAHATILIGKRLVRTCVLLQEMAARLSWQTPVEVPLMSPSNNQNIQNIMSPASCETLTALCVQGVVLLRLLLWMVTKVTKSRQVESPNCVPMITLLLSY